MSNTLNGTLSHRGRGVAGYVLDFRVAPAPNHAARTHFAGVNGDSEIFCGFGSRSIEARTVFFGSFTTRDKLRFYLDAFRDDTGKNGTLVYAGRSPKWTRNYTDCTFEGFEQEQGDLLDAAGLLDGGWFAIGTLRYTQLT